MESLIFLFHLLFKIFFYVFFHLFMFNFFVFIFFIFLIGSRSIPIIPNYTTCDILQSSLYVTTDV